MNATEEHLPWLVADIGGTHARFGIVTAAGGEVVQARALPVAQYRGPEDAVGHYLAEVADARAAPLRPRAAAFALAAAVDGEQVALTNGAWTISAPALRATLDIREVLLLNDLEALAYALPALRAADLLPLGGGAVDPRLPMAVIGCGTGLGVAACIPAGRRHRALATEGGHASLAAGDDFEDEVLRRVRQTYPHVSAERLLSGLGLPLLLRAVAGAAGLPLDAALDAAGIAQRAQAGTDPACVRTVEVFCAMLGGFAGNVALTLGARGGVLLAGGVALALRTALARSAFRARFEAKGRFRDYLAPIATALITAPQPTLHGAARALGDRLRRRRR